VCWSCAVYVKIGQTEVPEIREGRRHPSAQASTPEEKVNGVSLIVVLKKLADDWAGEVPLGLRLPTQDAFVVDALIEVMRAFLLPESDE
jgi:hypothetical protein